jgi:hypothetical protein
MSVPLRCTADGLLVGAHFAGRYGEKTTMLALATPARDSAAVVPEDDQVTVIEEIRAHPQQDLAKPWPRVIARSQYDAVDAFEAVDAIGFHLSLPLITRGGRSFPGRLSAVGGHAASLANFPIKNPYGSFP